MTALQPLQRRTQRQRSRYLDDSSTSVSMLQYGNDGAFLLSLQVALYNPAIEQEINLPSSGLVEELYAMFYTTILRNSIAFLFCTAVQDVLFVNSQNQNVCPTLIAAVRDNDVTTTSSMSGGGGGDDDDDDDALEDSVSIDSSNTNANVNATTAPTVTPTILDEVPYQIRVVPRNVTIGNTSDYAGDMFTFAIWYIDYTIVQIGSVYIEEAIIQTGNSDSSWNRTTSTTESVLDITDVSIEAVKAMNVVLQLTLDVNTMDTSTGGGGSDGDTNNSNNNSNNEDNENNSLFDTILQTISNSSLASTNTTTITGDATNTMNNNRYDRRLRSYLCSSPVVEDDVVNADPSNNIMIQKFTTLYEQYQSTYDDPYRPSTTFITPMRLGGIALFIATIAVYTILLHVSASRRKRRTMKLAARQQPHRKLVPQQSQQQQQQQQQQQRTAIHQNAAMSSSTKPMSNRVLAVPPSVPSSPMVRLARTDAR